MDLKATLKNTHTHNRENSLDSEDRLQPPQEKEKKKLVKKVPDVDPSS